MMLELLEDVDVGNIEDVEVVVVADRVVDFLKQKRQYRQCHAKLLHHRIISHAVQKRGITVTPAEIQAAADLFRHTKRLQRAEDALAWLESEMITAQHWEESIAHDLLTQKLVDDLFDSKIQPLFAQNRLRYEKVVLYQILLPSMPLARELFYQIQESEISFYEAAHLYDGDADRRRRCGFEGEISRAALLPEFATAIFDVGFGQVAPPIVTGAGVHLVMVQEIIAPELTPAVREEIQQALFDEWLESEMNYWLYR
jgi:parvulin-like peptidyl-prolyl isomerase